MDVRAARLHLQQPSADFQSHDLALDSSFAGEITILLPDSNGLARLRGTQIFAVAQDSCPLWRSNCDTRFAGISAPGAAEIMPADRALWLVTSPMLHELRISTDCVLAGSGFLRLELAWEPLSEALLLAMSRDWQAHKIEEQRRCLALTSEASELLAMLRDKEKHILRLEEQLDNLYASRSWRVTMPLRAGRRLLAGAAGWFRGTPAPHADPGAKVAKVSAIENELFDHGERLIPWVTHDHRETIRHMSSYAFFHKVIDSDQRSRRQGLVTIADLGSGVGFGCQFLAQLRDSSVLGVDWSPQCADYAQEHFGAPNIDYLVADLTTWTAQMDEFDYVVSRNAFEHVPDGLERARTSRWRCRLMFDVPYAEPPGRNPHHLVYNIREESFSGFPRAEIFFQDLDGIIYDAATKPANPNVIMCVCSHPDYPTVGSLFSFPLPAWKPAGPNDARPAYRDTVPASPDGSVRLRVQGQGEGRR